MKKEKILMTTLAMILIVSLFVTTIPAMAIAGVAPVVTSPSANPSSIPADGTTVSQLNVTVTDDTAVDTAKVDLTQIGGSKKTKYLIDDNKYSIVTNTTVGTLPNTYSLPVNATDIEGNSNAEVSIQLEVVSKGDINGDGVVNLNDAIYLAKHVAGWEGYGVIYGNGDINGNSEVDLNDAIYLAKHIAGWEGYEEIGC